MESYDRDLAGRVWQRVYSQPKEETDDHALLRQFFTAEVMNAAGYSRLASTLPASRRTLLQMAEEARRDVLHLKGLCYLLSGSKPAAPALPPPQEGPEATLRRCCRECVRWEKYCADHAADPEYGCIWRSLAKRKREQSLQILQILGSLP